MPMGVALRGSFVFDPDENYVRMKSTTMPLDVIWKSCSARYKRLPSFENGGIEVCPAGWKLGERR